MEIVPAILSKNKLETAEDLIAWSTVCNGANVKTKCRLQDIYARSNVETLKKITMEVIRDKNAYPTHALTFAISNTMGSEALYEICKVVANVQFIKQYDAETKELRDWEERLRTEQSTLHRRNLLRRPVAATE